MSYSSNIVPDLQQAFGTIELCPFDKLPPLLKLRRAGGVNPSTLLRASKSSQKDSLSGLWITIII